MNAQILVLASTFVLVLAVGCNACTPPQAMPVPPPPSPEELAKLLACTPKLNKNDPIPPEFLACKTVDDCTWTQTECCRGTVAVNKAHVRCLYVDSYPCEMKCPQMTMSVQCVHNTCTLVP